MGRVYVYELNGWELLDIKHRHESNQLAYKGDWSSLLMSKVEDVEDIIYPEMDCMEYEYEDPLDKPATQISPFDVYPISQLL